MENQESQKSTQSEQVPPDHLDEFEKVMAILADLPTDRAMKDISRARWGSDAIKQVVETMALSKMDLVHSLRHMRFREDLLRREIELLKNGSPIADKAMMDFVAANPNYKIEIVPA